MVAAGTGELLFSALDAGDMHDTNDVLDKHPECVEARDEELRVPLHYAADCADLGTFQRILNMNRSLVDAQDKFGFTPLLVAVMAGNLDVLEFLVEQGAQLGQLDRDGHSAVHWAVVCGQLDVLIALQRHGAPLALADIHGAHPLHYATVTAVAEEEEVPPERAEAILHVLLRQGAQLECTDTDLRTPLLWAASDGNLAAFRSLIRAGANRFAVDRDRLGVLHCAASHGHAEILREMLSLLAGQSGWAVDARDRNADTPLFYAATFGHWECAKLLLERGADPNHQDKRIRTAAHCAAAKGQLRVLKLLRQFSASFDLQNYRGDLPFHEAVQMGSKEIVDWLLGIDPNVVGAPNFYGRTALHLAAASGNMELVVLLCTRGAPVNALMLHKGELLTALDVARRRNHELIVDYLSGRHGALAAADTPADGQQRQRASIEEQLKTAKLRKIRAELATNEALLAQHGPDAEAEEGRALRRGKTVWMIGADAGSEANNRPERELVDASTVMSRRSSSASGAFRPKSAKVAKATSTTDLANIFAFPGPLAERMASVRAEKLLEEEEKAEKKGDQLERPTEEQSRPKRSDQMDKELEERAAEAAEHEHRNGTDAPERRARAQSSAKFRPKHSSVLRLDPENAISAEKAKKVQLAIDGKEKTEERERRIQRRLTPVPPPREDTSREGDRDEEEEGEEGEGRGPITELHILEEGYSPLQQPAGRMATFGEGNPSATRRYVHEKAIFDELTHLKRMQIQYGKVREEVLVRSLVQNFCRMHAIHPSHFRRVTSFHQWEKFLYDQLKMIYLEERDRISAAANAAAQRAAAAAGAAGMRPGALYSARQRIFAGGSLTSKAASASAPLGGLNQFNSRLLPRTNPLEERASALGRVYSGSSSQNSAAAAANSAAISATQTITTHATADAQRRSRRRQQQHKPTTSKRTTTPLREWHENGTAAKAAATGERYKRCECLEREAEGETEL